MLFPGADNDWWYGDVSPDDCSIGGVYTEEELAAAAAAAEEEDPVFQVGDEGWWNM